MNGQIGQAFVPSLSFMGIIRAAKFGGLISGCTFRTVFFEPCPTDKVLEAATLIGWTTFHGLPSPHFFGSIGGLAGFFENLGKPTRFLYLLLEPFLPMPI